MQSEAGQSKPSQRLSFVMLNAVMIKNEQELAELLAQCGYVSTPPSESPAWGFWQRECEGHELPLARAIGEFFFVAEGGAFGLYVLDPQDFWFHLVGYLQGDVSEQAVVEMLQDILDPFDWYHIMYRCREIKHEAGWKQFIKACPGTDTILPEFKKLVFDFLEAQVLQGGESETWSRSLKELNVSKNIARALRNLLSFLVFPNHLTPAHCYVMAQYFPDQDYKYFYEPPALKPILTNLKTVFNLKGAPLEQKADLHSALMKLIRRLDQLKFERQVEK
jgi:hypothetical protein